MGNDGDMQEFIPEWRNGLLIFTPKPIVLISMATMAVILSSIRAILEDVATSTSKKGWAESTSFTVDVRHAAAFPVAASVMLLLLFYFFDSMQLLLLLFVCCVAVTAFVYMIHPVWRYMRTKSASSFQRQQRVICGISIDTVMMHVVGSCVVLLWMLSGSQLLNDVIAVSLCAMFASLVRLPSLKVTVQLLVGLMIYDAFWVFMSARLFRGRNVMVEAALQQAENPAHKAAKMLHVSFLNIASHLELPTKLMVPYDLIAGWIASDTPALLLGLGDVAFPAMLATFLLSKDVESWQKKTGGLNSAASVGYGESSHVRGYLRSSSFWKMSYSLYFFAAYAVGVATALAVGTIFQAAQPALVYIVPCVLGTSIFMAVRRGEMRSLWSEGALSHRSSAEDVESNRTEH